MINQERGAAIEFARRSRLASAASSASFARFSASRRGLAPATPPDAAD
jgi:hypothetical protein